jgi:TPR repeat protein
MLLKNRGEQVSSNTNQHAKVLPGFEPRLKWYRLAAKQGLAEAQTAIDVMYAEGRGADTA